MDLGLSGRTAIVTGASKGIGLAVAEGLAAEGCNVHLVSRSAEQLERAAATIREKHRVDVRIRALDLSRSESVAALQAATGTPDILVNNAGAIPGGDLLQVDERVGVPLGTSRCSATSTCRVPITPRCKCAGAV